MTQAATPHVWNRTARVLHWVVAALIVAQFITGWSTENAATRQVELLFGRTHFQFGVLLGGLILLRLLWRLSHAAPPRPPGEPVWRCRTAGWVHGLIYLALLILPVTGYIVWVHMKEAMDLFGLVTVPAVFTPTPDDERLWAGAWYVHFFAGWMLLGLVALHVGAALYHQFVLKDGLIRRMVR